MDEIAYCGLDCSICIHASSDREGCAGCHQGGGAKDCHQRKCCQERSLEGCWQCEEFPCSNGFFGDEVWKGLCIGCCTVIKKVGKEKYTRLAREKMGEKVELGDYRFKTSQDIQDILLE
jgi:hypothetical protein